MNRAVEKCPIFVLGEPRKLRKRKKKSGNSFCGHPVVVVKLALQITNGFRNFYFGK